MWVLYFLLGAIAIATCRLAFRFLNWPGALPLIIVVAFFATYVWTPIVKMLRVPSPHTLAVTNAEIDGTPLPAARDAGIHSFTLTIASTYDTLYPANAAICAFVGPVYWSSQMGNFTEYVGAEDHEQYLGKRLVLVSLLAAYRKPLGVGSSSPVLPPADRVLGLGPPTPEPKRVTYLSTTPHDYLGMLDEWEWCVAGENLAALAASLNLRLDSHGVIQGDRVHWIGQHANVPADTLIDRNVAEEIVGTLPSPR